MSEYSLLNQEFHTFSKSPINGDQRLSNAVNKSGHTVTTSEIWSYDIPWFTEVSNEKNAIERAKDARYNDIILLNSKVYIRLGDKTNGASTGTTFEELWKEYTELNDARSYALDISAGLVSTSDIKKKLVQIRNSNDDVVIEYYVGYPIDLLTFENNSNQSSLSAARMFIDDGNGNKEVVEQFVSSTDKIYKGFPSTGYNVLVYTSTGSGNYTKVIEGETDDDFINNAYAGIIQFNKDRDKTHKFAASIYKYVGDTLDESLENIDVKSIFDEIKKITNSLTFTDDYTKTSTTKTITKEIDEYSYNSDIISSNTNVNGGNPNQGNYLGVCFKPRKNAIINQFTINEINLNEPRYLHIYKVTTEGTTHVGVSNGTQNIIIDNNEQFNGYASYNNVWNIDDLLVKEGEEYHFVLKKDENSSSASVASRIRVYPTTKYEYVIDGNGHRDTNYTPNFHVSGKEVEIISDGGKTSENITNDKFADKLYRDVLNDKHDISYLYDKKKVISFNDGELIIKDENSNDTTRIELLYDKDVQKAVSGRYTFRQPNVSEKITKNSTQYISNYVNDFVKFNPRINDTAASKSGHTGSPYYHERDVFSSQYDNDLDTNGVPMMSTLQNLINGEGMFLRANLSKFNDDLRCLMNGKNMFALNKNLTEFRAALPSLSVGDTMFLGSGIKEFNTKLPSLASAECMFRLCLNLRYVNTCIPNLCFAQGMFGYCLNLKHVDLSKNSGMCLYNADDMFIGCKNLTHCMLNLSYLETGENMFGKGSYSTQSDSSHVIQGVYITKGQSYNNPKLDIESIAYMADTIRDWSKSYTNYEHNITLGIGCSSNKYETSDYKEHIDKIRTRGWNVTIYFNDGSYTQRNKIETETNEPTPDEPEPDEPDNPTPDEPDNPTPDEPEPDNPDNPTPDEPENSDEVYMSDLNIVEGSKYIPDASGWKDAFDIAVSSDSNLNVTSVRDGYGWNDDIN